MSRHTLPAEVRLPNHEEPVAAVTIRDAQGVVIRVVPASEFRRPSAASPLAGRPGRRREGRRFHTATG
jgi:hypothetical protein